MADESREIKIPFSTLKGLSYWAGFLGICLLITGIFFIIVAVVFLFSGIAGRNWVFFLAGLAPSLVSLIPGVILLVSGLKLKNAKDSIKSYMISERSMMLENALDNLRVFFIIVSSLIVIILVFILTLIFALSSYGTSEFMDTLQGFLGYLPF